MIAIDMKTPQGTVEKQVEINEAQLGGEVRERLLRSAVVMYEANKRVGTAAAKGRSQIAGTTRKPYSQKGTGRARAGTVKSPLWRGGGVTFGPSPRDYRQQMPKKARRAALKSAVLAKMKDGEVSVITEIDCPEIKTKPMAELLNRIGVEGKCLIVIEALNRNLWLSCRNIPSVSVLPVNQLNAYDVIRHKTLLFTSAALDAFLGGGGHDESK